MIVLYLLVLAHLAVDFMQPSFWVRLSQESRQALVIHSGVYCLLTALILIKYSSFWWLWALFLGFSHLLIDLTKYSLQDRWSAANLYSFLIDQLIHLAVIFAVFYGGGFISGQPFRIGGLQFTQKVLSYLTGYATVTFAGSIFIFEIANAFLPGSATGERGSVLTYRDRYLGMVERALVLTFILFGQYFLVLIAFLPFLIIRAKEWREERQLGLVIELTASLVLASIVGFWLRFG